MRLMPSIARPRVCQQWCCLTNLVHARPLGAGSFAMAEAKGDRAWTRAQAQSSAGQASAMAQAFAASSSGQQAQTTQEGQPQPGPSQQWQPSQGRCGEGLPGCSPASPRPQLLVVGAASSPAAGSDCVRCPACAKRRRPRPTPTATTDAGSSGYNAQPSAAATPYSAFTDLFKASGTPTKPPAGSAPAAAAPSSSGNPSGANGAGVPADTSECGGRYPVCHLATLAA